MVTERTAELISELVGASAVRLNEPMSRHTSFRIGGKADLLAEPSDSGQIETLIQLLRGLKVPYLVLGNGSNVLVGDRGIRGVVVKLDRAFSACELRDNILTAQSGIKLSRLAKAAQAEGLTGLEFAAGIPGTLGGAVYMNAGAYGGEMRQVVEEVTYLDADGVRRTVSGDACGFGYRTSSFAKMPGCVILEAKLRLTAGDPKKIQATMEELAARRAEKQPLSLPSAGSTFKRPEGYFAGKLIQDAGLMGFRVGGASVSTKHAGFVVNDGGATAADVRELIAQVQARVEAQSGVRLEPEVKYIGEFE